MPSESPRKRGAGGLIDAGVYRALERELAIETDSHEVETYVRTVLAPSRIAAPSGRRPLDQGRIMTRPVGSFSFNDNALESAENETRDSFRMGFYGASRLVRESLRQNQGWLTFHGAALRIGEQAVMLCGKSQVGKTTLALALLDRGARLYSDEFVYLRRADRIVSGLRRTLLVRNRALPQIANGAVHDHCRRSPGRTTERGWRIWDDLDPREIGGSDVFAAPAKLSAVFAVESAEAGWASTAEPSPAIVAALALARRLNAPAAGLDRVAGLATLLAGVGTYRLNLGDIGSAADAIVARLREPALR